MSDTAKDAAARRRLGNWMPDKEEQAAAFRLEIAARARERRAHTARSSVVLDLGRLIEGDPILRMNLCRSIDEAVARGKQLGYSNVDELLDIIDYLTTFSPPFSETAPIATPMNAILEWPMCMPSGYAVFRDPAFNAQLRRVLSTWSAFLGGPRSRTWLVEDEPNGWFCKAALAKLGMEDFVHDRSREHWGFDSWNAFFTRHLRPGARPVASPDDNQVIVNSCEASPFEVRGDVKLVDHFWIKSQPYSLREMLTSSDEALARKFVGGTVYQGYLSANNYHRWHAPVDGKIVEAYNVDGTYYSDAESEGEDPGGLNDSQGYTTAIAARAVIVIDSINPVIGEMACVFVGMAEVSSCQIVVRPGDDVRKGDELGFFQFGGSTYCLLFQPGVIERFVPQPPWHDDVPPLRVNSALAYARKNARTV
ncbi:phosphatidylserine decarboxylase family protein [Paraburkholderia sp. JHI2823]|uniref:phosphatidylserine decarboxylase family protein n=1 Tax=Paraburkholderia TaxID=1822464 RepID=UPI000489F776|nr:phosphatidylserine decarboxylase family protein [Paraburkholderia mimosarum]